MVQRIALTLWVGGMWCIGYLAVPLLFKNLNDRMLAGELAGKLFFGMYILSLVVLVMLTVLQAIKYRALWWRNWRNAALAAAFLLVTLSLGYLQPKMNALKAQRHQGSLTVLQFEQQFKPLHGISSALYLLISALGLAVVAAGIDPKAPIRDL